MKTIVPGTLSVGSRDMEIPYGQPAMTRFRPCPPQWRYVANCLDPALVDIVIAFQTDRQNLTGCTHPRKVLYLQETSEAHVNRDFDLYDTFDLVLTNDQEILDNPRLQGRTRYMTLFGDWMVKSVEVPKTKLCSLLASTNRGLSGHNLRWVVRDAAVEELDVYGAIAGGPFVPTEVAYDQYYFNLAIENSLYSWWHTEKLFNCFAAKTVPIYWGCRDLSQLERWGFDTSGIIPWSGNIGGLQDMLHVFVLDPEQHYADRLKAVEHNFLREKELHTNELAIGPVICEYFGLEL